MRVTLSATGDLGELIDGRLVPATLLTPPGLAGCLEHRALVKILQEQTMSAET